MAGELRILKEEVMLLEASGEEIFSKHYAKKMPREEFDAIAKDDPTSIIDNKGNVKKIGKYTKWMLEMYGKKRMRLEDTYKAKEYLELFVKHLKRIPIKDRNINRFKTINDLHDVVKGFRDVDTRRDKKRAVEKGENEINKLYEDSNWLLVHPKTKDAACFYGKGTEWCTASLNRNYFEHYNKMGPMYIVINKKDQERQERGDITMHDIEKYQFHWFTWQFADRTDETYSDAYYGDGIAVPGKIIDIAYEDSRKYAIDKIKKEFKVNVKSGGVVEIVGNDDTLPKEIRDALSTYTGDSVQYVVGSMNDVLDMDEVFGDYYQTIYGIISNMVEASGIKPDIDEFKSGMEGRKAESALKDMLNGYLDNISSIDKFGDDLIEFFNKIAAEIVNAEIRSNLKFYLEDSEISSVSIHLDDAIYEDKKGNVTYHLETGGMAEMIFYAFVEDLNTDVFLGNIGRNSEFHDRITSDTFARMPDNIDYLSDHARERLNEEMHNGMDDFLEKYRKWMQ